MTNLAPLAIDDAAADLLFREARTAMAWTDQPVTDAEIEAAWSLAKFGPTAMNTLPLRVAVLRTSEAKARLNQFMPEGNQAKVDAAPVTLVLAAAPNFHETMDVTFPHAPGTGEAVFGGDAKADFRAQFARTNALLQAGYLIIGLRAAGLAAGPMNAADFDAVSGEFFGQAGAHAFLVVNIGHAEGTGTQFPRLPRFEFSEIAQQF